MTRQSGFHDPPGSAGIPAGQIAARFNPPRHGQKTLESPPEPDALRAFDLQPRTRVVFGVDSVDRVGDLAREIGAKKLLLVTDPGIVAAGHAERHHQMRRGLRGGRQIRRH